MPSRIVAAMFHLAAPWDVGGERLIHLLTSNFLETGNHDEGWISGLPTNRELNRVPR
jgi:hypothetical protein